MSDPTDRETIAMMLRGERPEDMSPADTLVWEAVALQVRFNHIGALEPDRLPRLARLADRNQARIERRMAFARRRAAGAH